jgi:hypothetical protein
LDDSPEHSEEESDGPVENQTSERGEEENPESDTDELPEDNDEENIVPHNEETPNHYKKEIQEPDTDELLSQYGGEYGDDETLDSYHKPKPPFPTKHTAEKPVIDPETPERGSSETIDDALFLSPGNPEVPAKLRVNKARFIGGCIVLIAIIAAVYFIGLPMLTKGGGFSHQSNLSATEITPIQEPTIIGTIPTVPVNRALIPQPTQLIPTNQKLYFQVQKNPVTSRISVIFAGSAGEGSFKSADIKVTHPDGSVSTGIIQPLKGVTEITLVGSKETDRVEIIAQMSSGEKFRVYDELVPLMR